MATPMSACLSAAASLTASPVIATTSPCGLHELHQPQLVLRGHPTEHVQLAAVARSARRPPCAANSAPVMPPGPRPSSAPIASAVTRWSPVIIRTSMPAALGDAHRLDRLGPQRVDDADQAEEHQVRDGGHRDRRRPRRSVVRVQQPDCQCEHPQARVRRARRCGLDRRASDLGHRHHAAVAVQRPGAAGEDDVRAALDQPTSAVLALVGQVVEGGHELVVRVERHGRHPRVGPAGLGRRTRRASRRAPRRRVRWGRRRRRRVGHGGVAGQAPTRRPGG